jgi:hypothetical protein
MFDGEGYYNFKNGFEYFASSSQRFESDIGADAELESYQLLWGFWLGDDQVDVYDEGSILNDMPGFNIDGMNLLVSGVSTYDLDGSIEGTADFTQLIDSIGGRFVAEDDDFTEIDVVEGAFNIDFGTGVINLTQFDVCFNGSDCTSATEKWVVNPATLTGVANIGLLEETPITGSATSDDGHSDSFDGFITGFSPASDDEDDDIGFVLGFNFNAPFDEYMDEDESEEVLGAALFTAELIPPPWIDPALFTSSGMLVTGSSNPAAGFVVAGIYGGPAIPNSSGMPTITARSSIGSSTFDTIFDPSTDSLLRADTGANTSSYETVMFPSTSSSVTWGTWSGSTAIFEKESETTSTSFSQNAFWFLAEPSAVTFPTSGFFRFDSVVSHRGEYTSNVSGSQNAAVAISTVDLFTFDIDFSDGSIDNGHLTMTTANDIEWDALFSGGTGAQSGPFINMFVDSGTISDVSSGSSPLTAVVNGDIKGYFVGDSSRDGIALGFTLNSTASANSTSTGHVLVGGVLLEGDGTQFFPSSTPEPTIETHNIDWGTWNNPIEDNWVVVTTQTDGVELQTSNHLAMIDPTPVANLTGTATYGSTAASSFIGSGSAGDVTQVVAGMSVDFNTGIISNGLLQVEVASSQAWEIDFAGSVNSGLVDINAVAGTLSDPGGVISNSIDADLGGVFTGNGAEAFVGGFDMIDELDQFNQVDGLYTIER